MFKIYPIAWITKSNAVMDFIKEYTTNDPSDKGMQEFMVADFAAGEHDRVPSFFVRILQELQMGCIGKKRITVYSIDLHALRLDSLLGKLEESALLDRTRVVQAKLETMDIEASLRPDTIEYLKKNPMEMTWLDKTLSHEKRIPPESFQIGVLNNDVVGYLHEYYKEYSDAAVALTKVYKTIKVGGLLLVTLPCSLYVVDNVQILESLGFEFLEGFDIDLADGTASIMEREASPESMSRIYHYSFLVFSRN